MNDIAGATTPSAYSSTGSTDPIPADVRAKVNAANQANKKLEATANNDARDMGQGQSVISDANPMRTIVLNKLASGSNPTDFSGPEAEAYSKLSTTEISAAKAQFQKWLASQPAALADPAALRNGVLATPPKPTGPQTVSAPDISKFLDPAKPMPITSTPAPVAPAAAIPAAKPAPMVASPAPTMPAMPSGKDIASLKSNNIIDIISAIADAYGSALSAKGGRDASTQLQRKAAVELQKQAAQNQADIDIRSKLALIPAQVKAAIDQAEAQGDIDTRNRLLLANGIQPLELEKIRAGKANAANGTAAALAALGVQ